MFPLKDFGVSFNSAPSLLFKIDDILQCIA
jgi:hypothetical protein